MNMPTILINGPRRCGSHLLYRLLDGHPRVFNALAEFYFFEYVNQLSATARSRFIDFFFETNVDELFDAVYERSLLPLFRGNVNYETGVAFAEELGVLLNEEEFKSRTQDMRKGAAHTIEGIWSCWCHGLQAVMSPGQEDRPILLKSTDYGQSAEGATAFLTNVKIVFLVRNPVYAISSLRKLRSNQQHRWDLTAIRLLSELTAYQDLWLTILRLESAHPDQTRAIRYEDIITHPHETLAGLCEFIGVPYDDALAKPTFNGQAWHGDSSHERHDGISTTPLRSTRILLSSTEQGMIKECLPEFLERFGYRVPIEPSSDAS